MAGLMAGLAIASLAITAGTTANSFVQAGREKKNQLKYESDADKALADAKRALQVNYAKQMSIKKDPYEKERLAMLSAGEQVLSSAQDSDRGAASAAGNVMIGGQVTQSNITDRQSDELINIENAILEEESRLRDIGVGLDLQEIQGNQQAAADARNASAQAKAQGYEGLANTASQGLGLVGLYGQNKTVTKGAIATAQQSDPTFAAGYDPVGGTNKDFRQFKKANPGFASDPRYMQALAGINPTESVAPATNTSPFAVGGPMYGGMNSPTQGMFGSYQGFGAGFLQNNQASYNQQPFNLMIDPLTGRPYGQ
jgi:hypothetical protein